MSVEERRAAAASEATAGEEPRAAVAREVPADSMADENSHQRNHRRVIQSSVHQREISGIITGTAEKQSITVAAEE